MVRMIRSLLDELILMMHSIRETTKGHMLENKYAYNVCGDAKGQNMASRNEV